MKNNMMLTWKAAIISIGLVGLAQFTNIASADGTEMLGTPGITISSGSGIEAAGTGLFSQPGTININVPGAVNQALLYWSVADFNTSSATDTVTVNATAVTGDRIGGPVSFEGGTILQATYRADITALIAAGANTLTLDNFNHPRSDGASVLVIFDDGTAGSIDIRDGHDYVFGNTAEPDPAKQVSAPQTFNVTPSSSDRTGSLVLSGGLAQANQADTTLITVNGTTTTLNNLFDSSDGGEWDTEIIAVNIPAGAAQVTVEIQAVNDSIAWAVAGLSVPPPPVAMLGDRVWEDRNVNGMQDCVDGGANDPNLPADGVIGNAGDTGSECDAGITDVPVNLLAGDCQTPLGQTVMTDLNGFYLFSDLAPGDYCVEFGKPPLEFCDTAGFDLGAPQFTAQNTGPNDAVDSDANTGTGISDPVSLAAGDGNLTVDAGIICPAKIGDRVWLDDNQDGIQDSGENGVAGVKTTLFDCGVDMIAGTADDVSTGEMRITGTDGMYMYGAEPGYTLDPGKYYVQFVKPDGTEFTMPNVNGDDVNSDCLPGGNTACTTLGSRGINLDRDCGLITPPDCDLNLDKTCRVDTPPATGGPECEAKIAASVLQYTGPGTPSVITVTGKDKDATVVSSFDSATGVLTVDARPDDLGAKMTITTDGVAEVIHTSCSAPYVAGQPAPLDEPKGDPSANWLVLSFVDKNGGSASAPTNGSGDGVFTDNCTITQSPQPSCDTIDKPTSLTFRYTGGACPGNNSQGSKSDCSGSVDGTAAVTISVNTGDAYTVSPAAVAPGETFTVSRGSQDFKSNTDIDLGNAGGTQQNDVHTSCSAPLEVGDEFGAVTLVGINGQTGGADVTYQYIVTNNGDPLSGVNVTDDLLGDIGGPVNLATGESRTFTRLTTITGTTVNVATASTQLGGQVCSASDTVTVTVDEPPVLGGECDGKVSDLVLKNLGAGAQVRVDQKKDGTVFDNFVAAGGTFSFSGTDKKNTLGTEISIFVDGSLNTKIHTSCSQPIGPGLVSGSFEVISGNSRNGGPLPPI